MSGKRYPYSVLSTALAQNHNNHGHTSTPNSSPSHQDHILHSNPNISHRLNMPLPPTPPAERPKPTAGLVESRNGRRGPYANGGQSSPAVHLPAASKLGAPSFASVVSSSTAPLSSARSPKPTISSLHQQQQHEHAQSSPSLLASPPKALDKDNVTTSPIASTNGHDVLSPAFTSSSQYQSPMTNPAGPAGNIRNDDHNIPSSDTRPTDSVNQGDAQSDETGLDGNEPFDAGIHLDHRLHDSASCMHDLVNNGAMSLDSNPNHLKLSSCGPNEKEFSNGSPIISIGSNFTSLDRAQQLQHEVGALTSSMQFNLRVSNSTDNVSAKTLSPLPLSMPLSSSPSHKSQLQNGPSQSQATAPHAPVHSTIPLPDIEDAERSADVNARQLQHLHHHQHQQMLDRAIDSAAYGNPIELSNFSVPQSTQHRSTSFGMPTSQSDNLLSITTSFDSNSPGGSSPSSAFPTSSSESALGNAGQKTPNVYINGLPPHFPEDQLFALASPYGEIRSVRTFTRHVRDSESGYGFVLFETVDAAERCIISLRRYRNLHPTFSKQIHKIPGTTYAQGSIPSAVSWETQGLRSEDESVDGSTTDSLGMDASFKAKMESLQDPTSTNLYMEGLPLSIDEPTLAALVSPHRISSSRFFQTRLSNPRGSSPLLETREGAEEIIERLHGRMVRGWNDTGSRISVRFADTSEQRELRRTERSAQEGDGSPARLTIAQAALLNLRGQELRSTNTGPVIHAHASASAVGHVPLASRQGFPTSISAPNFASNSHVPPVIGAANLEVDYSLAPGRGQNIKARSPYQAQYTTQAELGHGQPPVSSSLDPTMSALLDSLGRSGDPYQDVSGEYDHYPADIDYAQGQRLIQQQQQHLATTQSLDNIQQYARPAPVYTRSGYTATEEYIMRAHAESAALAAQAQQQQHLQAERRRPAPLDLGRRRVDDDAHDDDGANIAVGVRGYRTQASLGRLGQGIISPPVSSLASMGMANTMSEDEFHASVAAVRNDYRSPLRSYGNGNGDPEEDEFHMNEGSAAHMKHNPNIHPAHVNARLSRDPGSAPSQYQVQRPPMPLSPTLVSPASNQDSPNLNEMLSYQHAAAHMRSTTLPQHRSSSVRDGQQRGHYQHNSMSMPAQNLRTPQHASVATLSGNRGIDGAAGGTIYEGEVQDSRQSNGSRAQYPNSPMFDLDTAALSPSLISPTLTYSSQTPSTLSPATPFFGSFNNQAEGSEKGHEMEHYQQKKLTPPNSMNPSALRSLTGSR